MKRGGVNTFYCDLTKEIQVNSANTFIEGIIKLCDAIPWITVI